VTNRSGAIFDARGKERSCFNTTESPERPRFAKELTLKRHRAAALHDLAVGVARDASRQRLGVRQPYAAFIASILARPFQIGLALAGMALVLSSSASENRFIVDKWDAKDGLPQGSVIAMTQTRDGYLWLGTQQGLARFDGVHFKTFNDGNTPGLNSTTITKLFEDSRGNLWIGTQNGGVVMVDNKGTLTRIDVGRGAAESRLLEICEDQAGIVYMWLSNGQLYSYNDGTVGILFSYCNRIIVENSGWTWVGTPSGQMHSFRHIPGSKPLAFEVGEEASAGKIDFLLASKQGGYWLFANDHIQKWNSSRLDGISIPYPWTNRAGIGVSAACEDRDGNLIVGTSGEGIYWFDASGKIERLTSANPGLSHNTILSLLIDREGNLWVGTDGGGLNRVRRQIFDVAEGGRNVQSLSEDTNGVFWAVSGNELVSLNHGKRSAYRVEQAGVGPPRDKADGAVLVDREGIIWAGNGYGGALKLRDDLLRPVPESRFIRGRVFTLFQDRSRKLWVGAQSGLAVWDGSTWKPFPFPNLPSSHAVHAIVEDIEGNFWIGTEGAGLQCLRQGRCETFSRTNGLPSNNISSLYLDRDGVLWIGTTGGLARFARGKLTAYSKNEGMITDSVAYIADDSEGNLWLGSTAGLMCVQKKELNEIAAGNTKSALFRSFGEADGLPANECSSGFQPAACRASDGKLWFPTIRGVASVRPTSLKFNTNAPSVIIESIVLDGVQQNSEALHAPPPGAVKISPYKERLEIGFTSLHLTAPLKGRFKYKLEGYDSGWTEKPGDIRFATYIKLPPASYEFHVRACNEEGRWSNSDAVLAVHVLPPFWRTWWFMSASAICVLWMIAGSVYYVSTQRLHRQLESLRQQEALEKERARIARDLHDQLGANLTQVALLGEMAETDKDSPEEVETHAKQISQTARETTHALDEIVWTVNPSNDTLDGLINYVCKYAQEFLAMADLRYRLEVPSQLPTTPISPEVRHNVFLAAKESVNNVVKHASATSAWLRLQLEPHQFTLEIEDNGRGIAAADQNKGRSGLRNMRKRMEDIGGKFEMTAGAEGGTKVRLTAPLNSK
jgi:ligand-binding sensor domain-containing protein/signal transduction histidine kinase